MRHLLITSLTAAGLLLTTGVASAQYYPRRDSQSIATQDEREAMDHNRVFDRARSDLDRASDLSLPFTADRNRVVTARAEITECQRILASGDYDRRQFDDAISAVQRVADMNRLSDRNRDFLRDDVRDLQRIQARLES